MAEVRAVIVRVQLGGHGKSPVKGHALVDLADLAVVSDRTWYLDSTGYARSDFPQRSVRMHAFLMQTGPGQEVDHRNGDKIDNRRKNLLVVDRSGQMQNVPGKGRYRNVYADRRRGTWYAQVKRAGRRYYAGPFTCREEAREAAIRLRSEYLPHANEERHA